MKIYPRNRKLLIEPYNKQKKEDSSEFKLLLPPGSEPETQTISENNLFRVLRCAPDVSSNILQDEIIMVDKTMIEVKKVDDLIFFFILENHVYAVVKEL